MSSLRDVLSASTIPFHRARRISDKSSSKILFSNSLDFYPWMIDKTYKNLISITPSRTALHDVLKFNGQISAEVTINNLSMDKIDQPLFSILIDRWQNYYFNNGLRWKDLALMRSLNMANHASKLPASIDTRHWDYGRIIALWVSAFEILTHGGKGNRTGQKEVITLLESIRWQLERNNSRKFKCFLNGPMKKADRKALPCWLYCKLNKTRNDYLHGNPLSKNHIVLSSAKRNLADFAAPLYRMALTAFLELQWKKEWPDPQNTEAFANAIVDRMNFINYQSAIEDAIVKAKPRRA